MKLVKHALLLLSAGAVGALAAEEASVKKHHKKHHKHHHKHGHGKDPQVEAEKKYVEVNHTRVDYVPPTAEEKAAVDALNAHAAADQARDAAHVATKVATHAAEVHSMSQSALSKAREALKEARAGAGEVSSDQKEMLHRAETTLTKASKSVSRSQEKSVKYVKAKDAGKAAVETEAEERVELETKLGRLQEKLDTKHQSTEVLRSESELADMEREVSELQETVDTADANEDANSRRHAELEATKQELAELQRMIRELEIAEAKHQVAANEHDEMKIELEKLRDQVRELEAKQGQDSGTLVYEMPPAQSVPLRTVAEGSAPVGAAGAEEEAQEDDPESTPVRDSGIDIDTAMPYGELEPFGREDTAQELTEDSIQESDEMVDQLERAEVAEEKRAVFRALTRLRGAAITSFDGIARSQTGNIDEYNKLHKWRRTHPLHHLADEESDISKWAFPDNADF
jgi:myosin heavy subunit